MNRVLFGTLLILTIIWIIGVHKINSEQNRYIVIEATKTPEPFVAEEPITIATSTSISTTPKEKMVTSTPVVKPNPVVVVIPPSLPPPTPEPIPDFEMINTFARKAIVNILCTVKGQELSPISGTGVIINSNGLVLTNAHIAQYFLLKDLFMKDYITCVLRTGSPAYPKYNVELVYISPIWVKQNVGMLKVENPQGTGKNDYAFLRITGLMDGSNLNDIPYIKPNSRENIFVNEPVILVSYPAGFLGSLSILKDLNITSGITAVRDYFTFNDGFIDVISVPGTVVSQKGSSGGAVVDKDSTVIGIITTTSSGNTTGERDLAAITLGYINRSLKVEANINLSNLLTQDAELFGKKFREEEAPALTKLLTDSLIKSN